MKYTPTRPHRYPSNPTDWRCCHTYVLIAGVGCDRTSSTEHAYAGEEWTNVSITVRITLQLDTANDQPSTRQCTRKHQQLVHITYGLGAGTSHGFGSHRHVGVSEQRDGVRFVLTKTGNVDSCGITLQQTDSDLSDLREVGVLSSPHRASHGSWE